MATMEELQAENEKLRLELAAANEALKKSNAKAAKAKAVTRKAASLKKRAVGVLKGKKSAEEGQAALEAAFAGHTTELVFSDGSHEIRELAPLQVTGDAWRITPHGRVLNHEPELEPGDCQRQQFTLRGVGLLNEAGEQVGWCHLNEPVTIGRNQRFQLPHNSVRF